MPTHDYVPEAEEAPPIDASNLKCIEALCSSLLQNSNCCAADGGPAPGSPGSGLKSAAHKHEVPCSISDLTIQAVAIQVRDRLPARTEGFSLRPDRIGDECTILKQNSADFQRPQHLVISQSKQLPISNAAGIRTSKLLPSQR